MPKGIHHHNPPAPEFTSYIVAGACERSRVLREAYAQELRDIDTRRAARLSDRHVEPAVNNQSQTRGGFPKRRFVDDNKPGKRGVPHSNFLRRFKTLFRPDGLTAKILILHATRGWKAYA